jgi:uncharacterized RDD family membrane protein YckC
MAEPLVNASPPDGAPPGAHPAPERRDAHARAEILERIGPLLLSVLCWIVAAVLAIPLLLNLLAPFLAAEFPS